MFKVHIIEQCLDVVQMLYQVVFAKSEITSPFHIHTIHPRSVIPSDQCLSSLELETPTVVVIEYSHDAQDLLQLFSSLG